MNGSPDNVENALFPNGTNFDDVDRAQLLEQYKIMVQTSETLVARRQTVNTFFLSVNTLLLTAVGLIAREEVTSPMGNLEVLLLLLGISGVLMAIAWRRMVKSFRQLNTGKFRVIGILERYLPASMFNAEWVALGAGNDRTKYRPFTATEAAIPWVFGALYAIAILQAVA